MHYDFVEIGTSDFDTEIEKANENDRGISIDPILYYLNRLPYKQNVFKILCGISNENTWGKCYFLTEENIRKYNLPSWVRGCNSLYSYHPTVIKLLNNLNIDPNLIYSNVEIPIYSISTLFKMYQISSLQYLKIDTEGHDSIILDDYIRWVKQGNTIARKIKFETNILTNDSVIADTIQKLIDIGYRVIYNNENTLVQYD